VNCPHKQWTLAYPSYTIDELGFDPDDLGMAQGAKSQNGVTSWKDGDEKVRRRAGIGSFACECFLCGACLILDWNYQMHKAWYFDG
jgi:hypothetical protein